MYAEKDEQMKLYGKNPVLERIKAAPQTIKKLYLQERTDLSEIVRAAKNARLDFVPVTRARLESELKDARAQGVMAEIEEYIYSSFSEILDEVVKDKRVPVFLDGITDPQNFGSIIRTLACMGGFSVVLPAHGSAAVNETVLRVASGGENYVKIARVENIATAINKAKSRGFYIVGAEIDGESMRSDLKVTPPAALVIGAEGKGIRPGVKKCLDKAVSLPMGGAALSYNASVAAALFCYEIKKRM